MKILLIAVVFLLAACSIGITLSNTPGEIGACAPPNPGAGCR
jgi:hypothetical protein